MDGGREDWDAEEKVACRRGFELFGGDKPKWRFARREPVMSDFCGWCLKFLKMGARYRGDQFECRFCHDWTCEKKMGRHMLECEKAPEGYWRGSVCGCGQGM